MADECTQLGLMKQALKFAVSSSKGISKVLMASHAIRQEIDLLHPLTKATENGMRSGLPQLAGSSAKKQLANFDKMWKAAKCTQNQTFKSWHHVDQVVARAHKVQSSMKSRNCRQQVFPHQVDLHMYGT